MKSILTLLLFAMPIVALCQSKSSIDVMIGGHSTYRVSNRPFNEISKLNGSVGIHFNQVLSEQWSFRTGVQITAMGYKTPKMSAFQWGDQVNEMFEYDPTIPTMEPGVFDQIHIVYQRHFLGIPIAFRNYLNAGKINVFLEGGVVPSVLLSARNKVITDGHTEAHDGSYPSQRNFHLVGTISAGIQSTLSPGLQWFAQPIFRYHFTKTVDAPIKEHLYGVGLEIGVRKEMR